MDDGRWADLCLESEELCLDKNFTGAYDKVLLVLHEMTDIYGENALELVYPYLLLGDIVLKQNHLNQAEETLSLIKWILIKESSNLDKELTLSHNARMEKLYCFLMIKHRSFEQAMSHACRGAYYCSMLLGPEHIDTSQFYFHIGSIINNDTWQPAESSLLDSKDKGLGMFNKVTDIWYQFLTDKMHNGSLLSCSQSKMQEGARMLQVIAEIHMKHNGRTQPPDGRLLQARGLIAVELGMYTEAYKFVEYAQNVYLKTLGGDHPATTDAQNLLSFIRESIPSTKFD
ncbi:unnamed protein product [Albugo candida]|uniref:MalT-like TPR region domain-containing protein n=1 Tax=Albugo candida TaxID=65357 RepID=A0A024FUI9_9STRA|nr:unnamed protein product [Albugo candida]|eukprot:CCI10795.1 unnamed protein product [Albugo candida]